MIVFSASVARAFPRHLITRHLGVSGSGAPFSNGPDVFVAKGVHVLFLLFCSAAVVCELLYVLQGEGPSLETEFSSKGVRSCAGAQDHDVARGFVKCVGLRLLPQSEDAAEEAIEVLPIGLVRPKPLGTARVEGVFFFQILLRNGYEGCDVVWVRVRDENRCVGAAFRSDVSSQLSVEELFVNGLLSIDVVILEIGPMEV